MKEALLIKKVKEELKDWICWKPAKVRFYETDIFSVFDLCCWKNSQIKFIQVTTSPHISARRKKIETFMKKYNVGVPRDCEISVWGWNKKKKEFRKVMV